MNIKNRLIHIFSGNQDNSSGICSPSFPLRPPTFPVSPHRLLLVDANQEEEEEEEERRRGGEKTRAKEGENDEEEEKEEDHLIIQHIASLP